MIDLGLDKTSLLCRPTHRLLYQHKQEAGPVDVRSGHFHAQYSESITPFSVLIAASPTRIAHNALRAPAEFSTPFVSNS